MHLGNILPRHFTVKSRFPERLRDANKNGLHRRVQKVLDRTDLVTPWSKRTPAVHLRRRAWLPLTSGEESPNMKRGKPWSISPTRQSGSTAKWVGEGDNKKNRVILLLISLVNWPQKVHTLCLPLQWPSPKSLKCKKSTSELRMT